MRTNLHVTTSEDTTTTPTPAARFIRLEEAAERLSVSVKYLRAHRRDLRWIVELSPRVLRADEAAMMRWVERRKG